MEKIELNNPDTGETLSFYVVEQTVLSGNTYLLVTEDEAGTDSEDTVFYVLKKTGDLSEEEAEYAFVEDDEELSALGKVFEELI